MHLGVDLVFRELQPVDLDDLRWTGGAAHQQLLRDCLELSWTGAVGVLVGEVNALRLVACGGVDFRIDPAAGQLWMLIVDDAWQGLGVGTRLVAELEQRVLARGLSRAQLSVEDDNPRARELYERLGYRPQVRRLDNWPSDDGSGVDVPVTVLGKQL